MLPNETTDAFMVKSTNHKV